MGVPAGCRSGHVWLLPRPGRRTTVTFSTVPMWAGGQGGGQRRRRRPGYDGCRDYPAGERRRPPAGGGYAHNAAGRAARAARTPRHQERLRPRPVRRLRQHRAGHPRGRPADARAAAGTAGGTPMNPFRYERATDAQAAIAALAAAPNGAFLGGGTNLVDHMRLGVRQPDLVIDITRLPFDHIEPLPDGGVRVGALVRNSDLAADRTIRQRYPVLPEALLDGASGQLRNLATTGGNLLQRTRC